VLENEHDELSASIGEVACYRYPDFAKESSPSGW